MVKEILMLITSTDLSINFIDLLFLFDFWALKVSNFFLSINMYNINEDSDFFWRWVSSQLCLNPIVYYTFITGLMIKNIVITNLWSEILIFLKDIIDLTFLQSFFILKITEYPFFFFGGIFFLLSTMLSFFFLSYLGLQGVFIFNILTLFFFWGTIILTFNNCLLLNEVWLIKVGKWFYLFHNFPVYFEFYVDSVSISYMLLTVTISCFVQLYTFSYFRYEPLVERLVLFLNMFILSMIFFVSSANIILLFLGWELIGLTSFVLINFWVTRKATLKSAFKAFVFNKVSDIFFFYL